MQSGLKPIRKDHRDFSFHKTFGTTMTTQGLPASYNCDAGLWVPDQDIAQAFTGIPNIPALPYGCTDYTQDDLCVDEDGALYDPMLLENVTHANADGGIDMRTALAAAVKVYGRGAYFTIQSAGAIDWFDAIRLAMYSTSNEKRSVSAGTPWYSEFENPVNGVLPIPADFQNYVSFHNWKICGWKTIGDQVYLIGKSWQGSEYGDGGFHYVSRALMNSLLSLSGTGVFTMSKVVPGQVQTVDMSVIAQIVSFVRSLFGV